MIKEGRGQQWVLQGYNEDSGVGLVGLTVATTVKRYTFQGDLEKK